MRVLQVTCGDAYEGSTCPWCRPARGRAEVCESPEATEWMIWDGDDPNHAPGAPPDWCPLRKEPMRLEVAP